jgi:arginyl-tRNA--protein-N-Asp/Glu arginylyltransferase
MLPDWATELEPGPLMDHADRDTALAAPAKPKVVAKARTAADAIALTFFRRVKDSFIKSPLKKMQNCRPIRIRKGLPY